EPPHKVGMPRASVEDRLKMVEMSIEGNAGFSLSRVDIDRPGPHYAVDTIKTFQEQFPDADLHFLMGSDSLRDLLTWEHPGELVNLCKIVVMSRPVVPPDMDSLFAEIPELREKLISISSPEIEISSTNIVARVRNGQSVRYRVQESVREYIYNYGLYTNPTRESIK
ncbi:MAG TPA: nicotinate (nicotinamide) nucleotide adenylyltransferase, partial [Aggregatilineales bacterium]|nr:nicotinate (nicotinamide) nucleotide adenylyltransferase [Aggregatilineales bacterium]